MRVPKRLKKRCEEIIAEEKKDKARLRQAKLAKNKLEKEIEALRNKNKKSLTRRAAFVAKWIYNFWVSAEGRRCIKCARYAYGLILLYTSDFWNGIPSKPSSATVSRLILDENCVLSYRENYKWFPAGREINFGQCPRAKTLFEAMHPAYLDKLYKHLKSRKVWNTIEREIRPLRQ